MQSTRIERTTTVRRTGATEWQGAGCASISSLGLAQRIVGVIGLAAALITLGRYIDRLGHHDVSFGWFAYARAPVRY
jgi:hypothetical protein